ncbi:hypothetical protein ACFY12_28460 [Streptomyces sp. NPDC001339]|uniref:hypothetical protein n=1 Tax=Streptomyces sp. NPDC001339 TaxID=3364563 RepID=UPI00369AA0DD
MFEVRRDERDDRWYVVSTPDGHLAHIEGADGKMYGAFFDSEAEADKCANKLNIEAYRAAQAYTDQYQVQRARGGGSELQ